MLRTSAYSYVRYYDFQITINHISCVKLFLGTYLQIYTLIGPFYRYETAA